MTTTARTSPRFPGAVASIAGQVEERLATLLAGERARWAAVDAGLAAPIDVLAAFVAGGGKRLRPAFCHCAFVGAGGDPSDPLVIDAAAALELVHTFALIHDDVMDGSDTRRGSDAVHRQFVNEHTSARWRGEPRRFGEGMAILIGDFAFVYADLMMRAAPAAALAIYDELRIELCVGQSLDLVGTARAVADPEAARRIATYKSGKYTVERPLHLGAALAGRLDEFAAVLSAIGLPLGEAFQLRDDVLGVFGDEEVTGKPVGDDLREGKLTPLVVIATERATGDPEDEALLQRLGASDLDPMEIRALQELFIQTGAVADVERTIESLVAEARAALAHAPLLGDAREGLEDLAAYVAWRDR
ncbi:MAG: geranylgeranyl pyrophosphate synthase [Actinomycetia bacterium]|nr:geranylgeranyl pyrophosphate synthase [Actinomycetes bacterium]